MRTPHSLSAAVMTVVLLAVTACSGEPADTTQPAAAGSASAESITTPEYLAFRAQPTACGAERPEPAVQLEFDAPTDLGLSGTIEVVLDTSCGDISLSLDADGAPVTVNSFVFLAERGYFDGIALHRVVPGFVIQIGDPTATGAGFPGYRIRRQPVLPGARGHQPAPLVHGIRADHKRIRDDGFDDRGAHGAQPR
jgi:peptidyl-prolyl cis-trans isomerase B (cyclophilin B)